MAARTQAPGVPAGVDASVLDREVRDALRGLGTLGEPVGQHLAAAGILLDDDPVAALAHAQEARRLAPRLAVVREALGVAAYAAGDFALARSELRAARRMTGNAEVLPLLADCERALGHPDRALAVGAEPDVRHLDGPARIELAIVLSGARRDLGQPAAALRALELPALHATTVVEGTVRLWYAYAEALLADGRNAEAATWFGSAADADEDDLTDASERLATLERAE